MENPTVRSIVQFVLLVVCLGGGYLLGGWAGLGLGLAVFALAIVLMTIPRMSNLSKKNQPATEPAALAPGQAAAAVPEQAPAADTRPVPQDRRPKQSKTKPKMEYPTSE